ncbi:MAG: DUF3685 domain-containing protein [Tannerellaceae bacterium]|nr:DUF3685 domain-containing protein [Tannerellaceae bacterium]
MNKILVAKIAGCLSSHVKLIDYVTESLGITAQSAYRRIRSEIPFTFEEIGKLSRELNFSVDEVIGLEQSERALFELQGKVSFTPRETFSVMLDRYCASLQCMYEAKEKEWITTMNHLLALFAVGSEHLFRFFYYKWIHQTSKVPINYYFSEVTVPSEFRVLCEKICHYSQRIRSAACIIDRNLFPNTVKEIQYYYKRGLISDEEIEWIRNDLSNAMDYTEKLIREGVNGQGISSLFYLSSVGIETNSTYMKYDDTVGSYFWVYMAAPINTHNGEVCAMHKKWLDSLKKYTVLITQSNEKLQSEFIDEQRRSIDRMTHL